MLHLIEEALHALGQRHELKPKLLQYKPALGPAGHPNLIPRMPVEDGGLQPRPLGPRLAHELGEQIIGQRVIGLAVAPHAAAGRTKRRQAFKSAGIDCREQMIQTEALRSQCCLQASRCFFLESTGRFISGAMHDALHRPQIPGHS